MRVTKTQSTHFELTIEMDDKYHVNVKLERFIGNDFGIVEFPRNLTTLEEHLQLAKAIFDSDSLRVDTLRFYVSIAIAISTDDPSLSNKGPKLTSTTCYCSLSRGTKESPVDYYKNQIFSLFKDIVLSGK